MVSVVNLTTGQSAGFPPASATAIFIDWPISFPAIWSARLRASRPVSPQPMPHVADFCSSATCGQGRTASLECRRTRLSDRVILSAGPTTDANRADYLAVLLQWNATRENHDFPVIGCVNAKELVARLRMFP
jgi:hypothetical protein